MPQPEIFPNHLNDIDIVQQKDSNSEENNYREQQHTHTDDQETGEEKKDTPKTLNDLRDILMSNIKKIQDGSLPLDKAREIVAHSNSIINLTKVELEYHKYLKPNSKKALGDRFKD